MSCGSLDGVVVKREPIDAYSEKVIVKVEAAAEVEVKRERIDANPNEVKVEAAGEVKVKREQLDADPAKVKSEAPGEVYAKVKTEPIDADSERTRVKKDEQSDEIDAQVKKEHGGSEPARRVKEEVTAAAPAETVRISTNRAGEIGKLSPEWARCLAPLVSSSKVMIQGKMVFPMMELRLMQEVLLYVSFYIHRSSSYLVSPKNAHHPNNSLRGLFKLLGQFGVAET